MCGVVHPLGWINRSVQSLIASRTVSEVGTVVMRLCSPMCLKHPNARTWYCSVRMLIHGSMHSQLRHPTRQAGSICAVRRICSFGAVFLARPALRRARPSNCEENPSAATTKLHSKGCSGREIEKLG